MKNLTLRTCLFVWFCLISTVAYCQREIQYTEPYKKIVELCNSKVEYEKFQYFKSQSADGEKKQAYEARELDAQKKYQNIIKEIKSNPKLYLTFINKSLEDNEKDLKKAGGFYQYVNTMLPFDPQVRVKLYDFFKIVRYSLFEKDLDRLPPLEEIPFFNKKKWKSQTSYEELIKISPEIMIKEK